MMMHNLDFGACGSSFNSSFDCFLSRNYARKVIWTVNRGYSGGGGSRRLMFRRHDGNIAKCQVVSATKTVNEKKMASTVHSVSTTLIDGKAPLRQPGATATSQCVTFPSLPSSPLQHQNRAWKATGYCGRLVRNVAAMATGEVTPEVGSPDVQELIKPIQEAWEKVEDKYAVSSLIVAGGVLLWGSTGLISAIDRLPLIPGVLELVGIGYTGWFAYKNLVFKPDREALVEKIKGTYKDIIGSS